MRLIKTLHDGTIWDFMGHKTTPVEMDPRNGSVTKCLWFTQTSSNRIEIRYDGDVENPVKFNLDKPTIEYLSLTKTLCNGTVFKFMGDKKDPGKRDPINKDITKCLWFSKTSPDGIIRTYNGNEKKLVEVNLGKNIAECLWFTQTSPDGIIRTYYGNIENPVQVNLGENTVKCLWFIENTGNDD